ncbi:acyl-CoA synthetase [Bradyrhizobium sp. U87765 SZCCT0131]|uniref:acyl-CoA synthetase n=1 Tax=unclassified Bradyrhizobium TaxID=2631580 RepID=UPI001BAD4912|nr:MULTISPECIES: acyl-CoA synthetase [unclassified Bradyrhizobium]MBR1217585.1 acyl-CoA synthetase [Bradyrhizobium sp. U87765 SZCCT0131]MBR1264817.1 acyl-CoA synthetase [Bradyrhizobium sp. U87765 SZCCT0134]MBR1304799.1 acyl-CoA synthetase [Bradyrhizobium sp. U87765 SZCCT0110]MBR1320586.1 acyl-CoA synthetase [Bradyrhizobium sp. U87765 SZCCT0109]MBR1349006.1 acyl-CoA synthetase [Bradyrhizobium sp. U87765 SZCCT0048]
MSHPSLHARTTPDKIAYRMAASGDAITYRQLDEHSNQGAQLFRSLGLKAGDHVALLMENSLAFMEICWAAQRSGLYYTAISRYLTADEIAYIIRDCGARVMITSEKCVDAVAPLLAGADPATSFYMTGTPHPGFRSWDKAIAEQPTTPISDEVAGYDMLYSSGTTGRPKGIKREATGDAIDKPNPFLRFLCADMCGMSSDTIYLSPAPLYHAAPLRFNMMVGVLGGTSIIMESFDAETFLRLVQEHRATQSQLVPTMFVRMLKLPDEVRARYDVSSLKGAIHAAAPCPVDVKARMIEWWGPILIEYYAGSEGNGVTVSTSAEWLSHRGTVGRAVVGKIRILDENDEEVPTGEIGTVYFADAPQFAYHNDPDKTKRAYNSRGWSTLGDVGYVDEGGYLYLTDRKAYMIISGGVNIYPQETEDVLITHPAVADVAVFGVPNEEMGEEVKAVVQPHDMSRAGKELEAELIAFCRQHLSPIKCPRTVDFDPELPRTPTGKLVKRHLRDRYWPAKGGTAA